MLSTNKNWLQVNLDPFFNLLVHKNQDLELNILLIDTKYIKILNDMLKFNFGLLLLVL